MLNKLLVLSIIFIPYAFSKVDKYELKGIDILESSNYYLNPGNGILFYESGLLENVGELSYETKDLKEPDDIKKARKFINILFHRKPSGFVPSNIANKISAYLHPGQIGSLLKLTLNQDRKTKNWQKTLKNKIIDSILQDKKIREKIESNRLQFCKFDLEVKKIESDTKAKDLKISPKLNEQLSNLKKYRSLHKVFNDIEKHYCQEKVYENSVYKKNDLTLKRSLNDLANILSIDGDNLLVTRTMLALLWHKVEKKGDFAIYFKELTGKDIKLSNEKFKEDAASNPNKTLILADYALNYFYKFYIESKYINLLNQEFTFLSSPEENKEKNNFADCGSTSLRNFIRLLSFDGHVYNTSFLRNIGASKEVIDYFKKYSTNSLQSSQEARNDWGKITSNKGANNELYLTKIGNNLCEINFGAHNMLKIMNLTLFSKNEKKPQTWKEVESILAHHSETFSISNINLEKNFGYIKFEILGFAYEWNFLSNHFYIDDLGKTSKKHHKDFLEIVKEKSKYLSELGEIENSLELSWLEYAKLINFSKPCETVDKETDPKEKILLLNLKSYENIINAIELLDLKNKLTIRSLIHKLKLNDDAFARLIDKIINDKEKLKLAFSESKNRSFSWDGISFEKETSKNLMDALSYSKSFQEIFLFCSNFNSLEEEFSKTILQNKTLKKLLLTFNELGNDSGQKISRAIKESQTIEHLELSNSSLNFKSGLELAEFIKQSKVIKTLDLHDNSLGPKSGIEIAKSLEKNKTLETINLSDNKLEKKATLKLIGSLKENITLKKLNLSENISSENETAENEILLASEAIKNNKTIESLNLSSNRLSAADWLKITEAFKENKSLIEIRLKNNNLTKEVGVKIAEALTKNNTLTHLDLKNNNLTKEVGVKIAEALTKNNTLTHLDLDNNNLTAEAGRKIAEALTKNNTLTHLDLDNNNLTTEAGRKIAEALTKNNTLTHLSISHNKLATEAIVKIAEALTKNNTLTHLNISHNKLATEAIVKTTEALTENNSLKYLNIGRNISDEKSLIKLIEIFVTHKTLNFLVINKKNLSETVTTMCETINSEGLKRISL